MTLALIFIAATTIAAVLIEGIWKQYDHFKDTRRLRQWIKDNA
jgi:hypothetical protein